MNSNTRNPDAIESDIQRTRSAIDDTLTAIEHKFTPGQLVDQAMSYLRGGPGEFGENLATSVKNNPLPVLLIGAGIAWLMTANNRPPARAQYPVPAGPVYRSHEASVGASPGGYASSAGGLGDKVGEAADAARSRAAATGQSVKDTAAGVRERAGQLSDEARHRVGAMAEGARENWDEWSAEATWRARQARQEAAYQARRARHGFLHLLDEQPLVLGAIGLAVGAALGAALPGTRQEDEWVGETRDEWLHRARTLGEEHLHRAERVAEAAGEAALQEAEQEGLSPQSGREAVETTRDKAGNVADAAKEAARREADAQGFKTPSYQGAGSSASASATGSTKPYGGLAP